MEFEVASRSVHSQVLDPEGKRCDPQGDDKFRAAFMDIAKRFMAEVCASIAVGHRGQHESVCE